ncbi:uncharacterized protein LOC124638914 [Helicoverpa zea]|uniref:uncharacterized protein LOC124638914 n=1 Tax=Helicoverpa zea TaxID=7113 RepID=UPI001F56981C|nr:uncharacterized protein LOC124638914 [Helicoverpa zea]
MAHIQNLLIFVALCYLAVSFTEAAQGGLHLHIGGSMEMPRQKRHNHNHNHKDNDDSDVEWIACDYSLRPRMRCHDCHTRLICKKVGGLLLHCPAVGAPYCNNGLCSPEPSTECA